VRLLRNPVLQFLLASLLLFGVTWWGTGQMSQRAARNEAVADARATTELLAHSVAEPAIPKGLVNADPGAIDRFDRAVGTRLLVQDVARIKIWRSDGTVVYSDKTQLIGQHFPLDGEQLKVLHSGATEGSLSDLRRQENRFEKEEDGLLEVYTRIDSPEGPPLLFEAYYTLATVKERAADVLTPFRRISTLDPPPRRPDDRHVDAQAHPRRPRTRAAHGAGGRLLRGGTTTHRP
jgi:two-component system NarL family sensor kinase